ncbi:chlorite dismutase family protein [Leucobacter sp. cx-328]|uniref:hydrogen peroxide-dependent heme synthase n=1 Tax=unclassified Leucobacter TaxID=2621730 RepID=UPI00165EA3C8|nr:MULTISPECIES: hydrogen peroxide-dependent heme synthase [unclassified Leucobacter]MBC9944324.1 chlorite dismutase family protein [Leucobacter sp. cx-328]
MIDHSAIAESVNDAVNYTMFAVFAEDRLVAPVDDAPAAIAEIEARIAAVNGLEVRGWYDISGFRADADIMVWFHAPTSEALQAGYRAVIEGSEGRLSPVWSNIGVHRTAEFNRSHIPAFLAGETPGDYVCVYPFVRSYDWYLLPEAERSQMLREHGAAARDYTDVLANTVSSFALGDYEWLLAFEANDLLRIVDLMRDLRATEARRHVREETPFFTGPRVAAEVLLTRALG